MNQIESQRVTKAGSVQLRNGTQARTGSWCTEGYLWKGSNRHAGRCWEIPAGESEEQQIQRSADWRKDKINFKDLEKYGTVKQLTLDESFSATKTREN